MKLLPDDSFRYWPKKLVPLALEAGWQIHPESRTGDWAVMMIHVGVPQPVPAPVRTLVAYAGAEA